MDLFYKNFRNYKNLDNFYIKGQLICKEKWKNQLLKITYCNPDYLNDLNNNYCPKMQNYFFWKDFIFNQQYYETFKHNPNKILYDSKYLYSKFWVNESSFFLGESLWKKYSMYFEVNKKILYLKNLLYFIHYKKNLNKIKIFKKFFLNRVLKLKLLVFKFGKTLLRNFFKQFLKINIFYNLFLRKKRKKKLFPCLLQKINRFGFKLILFNFKFFIPFNNLNLSKKKSIKNFIYKKFFFKRFIPTYFFCKIRYNYNKINKNLQFTIIF